MSRPLAAQLGMLVVGLGTLVAPLDTAVNIAFPSITQAFALSLQDIRWLVIAYVLTYASLMLACGRLGDLVGYRPIFQLGLLLSALGLLICAAAPSYGLLLFGRVLQGVGVALTVSCGPALVTSLLDESERARALAFYAGVIAIGSALGPIVGGLLVGRWGWAAVFWFRVPIAILALALSGRLAAPRQSSCSLFG
jgi:MFS family permease